MDLQLGPDIGKAYNNITQKIGTDNPVILISLTVIIIFYYFIFNYLGTSAGASSSLSGTFTSAAEGTGVTLVEIFLWGLFIFLILINGLQYFFQLDIKAGIKKIFTPEPEIDITLTHDVEEEEPVPEITYYKQVYHIPDNKYTYDDAKALCKAYGSELANYDQIEKAYRDGAEWCGYGWSKEQMAFYPTQKKTYDKLQKMKGHEHDCGRPGINGGYIANKNVRFGVNCYGYKPEMTSNERSEMNQTMHVPKTHKEREFDKKVDMYRKKLPDIMVSPFNNSRWSQI